MAEPEPFLFVSHVTEDRAAALKIVDELERRGIPCWIAPRNIEPGKPFDDEIVAALERALHAVNVEKRQALLNVICQGPG